MTKKTYLPIIICGMSLLLLFPKEVNSEDSRGWYAGTWDSTIYNRAEKPRNVAIRFEIRDSDTDIPVRDAQVTLEGKYLEEWVGRPVDQIGPLEPQEKEFRLTAKTNEEGVAVFALSWQKEYPWRSYFGDHAPREYRKDGGYSVKDSWIRAVDDIEKVQQIEIRHPRYHYKKIPFNFRHLMKFGQDKGSELQRPELFDKFEQAWIKEIKRKNVKFCVLNLGTKFKDFQNTKCRRPEFFEKVRKEDWGTVYQRPYNLFSAGGDSQSECGPYFVYLFDEVPIERRTQEIEIIDNDSKKGNEGTLQQRQVRDYGFLSTELPEGYTTLQEGTEIVSEELKEEYGISGFENAYNFVYVRDNGVLSAICMIDFNSEDNLKRAAISFYKDVRQELLKRMDDKEVSFFMKNNTQLFKKNTSLIILVFGEPDEANRGISKFIAGIQRYKTRLGLEELVVEEWKCPTCGHVYRHVYHGDVAPKFCPECGKPWTGSVTTTEADDTEVRVLEKTTVAENAEEIKRIAHSDPFGIAVETLTRERAQALGLSSLVATNLHHRGVIVNYVLPDSPADRAELEKNHIIDTIYRGSYEYNIFSKSDYDKAITDITNRNATEIKMRCWQFPDNFDGNIDYNKHLKEVMIQLSTTVRSPGTPIKKTVDLGNGIKMEFILIPSGEFDMGSPSSEKDRGGEEGPVHKVKISNSFYMSNYEVTQNQYIAIMGKNPSHFKGGNLPVEQVSWQETVEFCKKLSQRQGRNYRLPTEAEWEYACRAGSQTRFHFSDDLIAYYAWYRSNSDETHAVGQKKPNPFGLYDMHGNVWEWCSDWASENYYRNSPSVDPQGPTPGKDNAPHFFIIRGGSFINFPRGCRSASRKRWESNNQNGTIGFRVVLDSN